MPETKSIDATEKTWFSFASPCKKMGLSWKAQMTRQILGIVHANAYHSKQKHRYVNVVPLTCICLELRVNEWMKRWPCIWCRKIKKCRDPGSNRGPSDLRSDALPTELSRLDNNISFRGSRPFRHHFQMQNKFMNMLPISWNDHMKYTWPGSNWRPSAC